MSFTIIFTIVDYVTILFYLYFIIGTGCPIVEEIAHGRLNVVDEGAKLEVICDVGYTIDGPSFIYCDERLQWSEKLKGCKG